MKTDFRQKFSMRRKVDSFSSPALGYPVVKGTYNKH